MVEPRVRQVIRVPDLLSAARVPLGAAFPLASRRTSTALAVLALAGLTDVLDGWAARKLGQATPSGAIIDGLADKLFAASVLFTLVRAGKVRPRSAFLLATRELMELPLAARVLLSTRAHALEAEHSANELGKLATALELGTVAAIVLGARAAPALVAATAAVGFVAGLSYWRRELGAPAAPTVAHRGLRRTTRS